MLEYNNSCYKLSVIIPIYNNAQYLLPFFHKVLLPQTIFQDMELIFVNNNQTPTIDDYYWDLIHLQYKFRNINIINCTDTDKSIAELQYIGLHTSSCFHNCFVDVTDNLYNNVTDTFFEKLLQQSMDF